MARRRLAECADSGAAKPERKAEQMVRRNDLTLLAIACADHSLAMAKEERMGEAKKQHASRSGAWRSRLRAAARNATNPGLKKLAQYEVAAQTIAEIFDGRRAEAHRKQTEFITKTKSASPAFDDNFLSIGLQI